MPWLYRASGDCAAMSCACAAHGLSVNARAVIRMRAVPGAALWPGSSAYATPPGAAPASVGAAAASAARMVVSGVRGTSALAGMVPPTVRAAANPVAMTDLQARRRGVRPGGPASSRRLRCAVHDMVFNLLSVVSLPGPRHSPVPQS
ncbi:hypothetical protein CXF46_10465 [Corynebacterium bovis]|nr:hypothetical protein CXF36_03335 [Corynebacterium bovis]RRO84517.1 hypothetical protein CXF37_03090 [Corynebacterium bovis]RRO91669.1 hypothetical protein CXF45_03165 [Corynebacterium bovis]RRO95048.1 hypothetical protein CXF29_05845 [Corynebacterium bovis]RRQ14196.1 hypothetical protein CXF46_10465 [Corynebacterium bovis]